MRQLNAYKFQIQRKKPYQTVTSHDSSKPLLMTTGAADKLAGLPHIHSATRTQMAVAEPRCQLMIVKRQSWYPGETPTKLNRRSSFHQLIVRSWRVLHIKQLFTKYTGYIIYLYPFYTHNTTVALKNFNGNFKAILI